MSGRKGIYLILLFFLVLTGCARAPDTSAGVFRLIDKLEEKNITSSPLIRAQAEDGELRTKYPVASYPLAEAGIEENPFEIKRKLKLGGAWMNVLFSPPESTYSFPIKLTNGSCLRFGIGIIQDEHSKMQHKLDEAPARGVNFQVALEVEGKIKKVFQRYLASPDLQDDTMFSFFWQEVDLPYSVEEARLSLVTQGGPHNSAFWINPVLFDKGDSTQNVILISVDTLRADHLGCYGYARNTSPNIDVLAADGAVFSHAYASSPWTLPSHVSILTSLHGVHHQVYREDEKISSSLLTMAEVFRKYHYTSAGITGGGFVSAIYGFSKGFDAYYDVGGVYRPDSAENTYAAVSDWLYRHHHENFFLFIHTYQPHSPYDCPPPFGAMFLDEGAEFERLDIMSHLGGKKSIFKPLSEEVSENIIGLYDGEIRYTDEKLIGPLVGLLEELSLYDRTMIVFLSDHGEEFYDHGGWGHGHSLYDEALRVPLIIKFPQSKYRGTRCENIVSLVDVMPTIFETLGYDFMDVSIDGRSFLPVLNRKENQDRRFVADVASNVLNSHIPRKVSTNQGRFKVVMNQDYSSEDLDYFTHLPQWRGAIELYDLAEDWREQKNLADVRPLHSRQMTRWIEELYAMAGKLKVEKADIDDSLEEQLKALGYIR